MEGALTWLSEFIRFLADFVPHRAIVKTTHGAVKFVGGAKAVPLGPGVHWYWPYWTEFWEYPTARQALDLPTQTVVTADERVLAAGGIIVYEVEDILALVAQTYSPDQAVKDIALTAFHEVLCQRTWLEIRDAQRAGTLDRDVRREAAAELKKYGVRVLKTSFTDLAPCRVLKLNQTTSRDGGLS